MTRKNRSAAAKKAHDEIFAQMLEGGKQAVAIMRGEADPSTYRVHFGDIDVKSVRKKTNLTQDGFANTFGFSTGSVRDWEQGRVQPDHAVRAYLYVIGQKPDVVRKTLAPLTLQPKGEGYVSRSGNVIVTKSTRQEAIEAARATSRSKKRKMVPAHVAAKASGARASRSH